MSSGDDQHKEEVLAPLFWVTVTRPESRPTNYKTLVDENPNMACFITLLAGKKESPENLFNKDSFQRLLDIIYSSKFPSPFTAFVEHPYVDRFYRDAYYLHYSGKHFDQVRDCSRVIFYDGDAKDIDDVAKNPARCIGVCVLQPNGVIGRSYFNPRYFLDQSCAVRTAPYTCTVRGCSIQINAFPYMMQDQEATTCAEVTALNLSEYYSRRYDGYPSLLLRDIERVHGRHGAERVFPSKGMTYQDLSRVLSEMGRATRLWFPSAPRTVPRDLRRLMCYYAQSAIPFAVALKSQHNGLLHSVICIGHGKERNNWLASNTICHLSQVVQKSQEGHESLDGHNTKLTQLYLADAADAYDTFVIMDDGRIPYTQMRVGDKRIEYPIDYSSTESDPWQSIHCVCLPLYKKTYLEAVEAQEIALAVLQGDMGIHALSGESAELCGAGECAKSPLIYRLFLASAKSFTTARISALKELVKAGKMPQKALEAYQGISYPRSIWVCELYTTQGWKNGEVLGELVIDATAKSRTGLNGIVLIHYPHWISGRLSSLPIGALETNNLEDETNWCKFPRFSGNLDSPT